MKSVQEMKKGQLWVSLDKRDKNACIYVQEVEEDFAVVCASTSDGYTRYGRGRRVNIAKFLSRQNRSNGYRLLKQRV